MTLTVKSIMSPAKKSLSVHEAARKAALYFERQAIYGNGTSSWEYCHYLNTHEVM